MTFSEETFPSRRTKSIADLELELETFKKNANDALETSYLELRSLHEENSYRADTIYSLESKVVSLQSTVDSFTPWKDKPSSSLKDDSSESYSECTRDNGNGQQETDIKQKEVSSMCLSNEKPKRKFNTILRINSAPILQRVLKQDTSSNSEASLLLRVQELELKLQQREAAIENLERTIVLKDQMFEALRSEIDRRQ
mmetsp:Transcript_28143/g.39594  ORF Transcript_28143/g.39594 Transcript_28143/m.39594 type:complete len:198 (-) Transcript_28143:228-821(-)